MQKVCLFSLHEERRPRVKWLYHWKNSQIVENDIDFADERVPQAICNACRTLLQKRDAGDMSVSLPAIYNFSAIIVKPLTRTSGPCDCLICQIAKLKLNQKHPLAPKEQNRNLDQGESSKPGPSPKSRLQSSEKRCAQCLSILARGFRHSCTIGTRHQNLQALVQSDPVGAEQIASAIISSKDASPGGIVRLSQVRGGQLFPLTPGNNKLLWESLLLITIVVVIIHK
jgi:hypothetical protein